jgi:hypothetical protein
MQSSFQQGQMEMEWELRTLGRAESFIYLMDTFCLDTAFECFFLPVENPITANRRAARATLPKPELFAQHNTMQ